MDLTANFLVDSVRSGDVVLVLGAGASIGASDSRCASPPTGPELARQISEKCQWRREIGPSGRGNRVPPAR